MSHRLARHARLIAFAIGGAGVVAELALLAALGANGPDATATRAPTTGSRIELPAAESGATILLKAMEVSL